MRVAVWGAGEIGRATAYRLSMSPFVNELHWVNRRVEKIRSRVVDIQHGLAFAPTCHLVRGYPQERAARALGCADVAVLTVGQAVPEGGTRAELLSRNMEVFRESVVPALRGYRGIVLVVTNPVDALTLDVYRRAGLDAQRCLGLGTVVETARLRAALAKHMRPQRPAREVFAYAVGTQDEHFVPVTAGATALAAAPWRPEVVEMARKETVNAARRVKQDSLSTLHPVVEGIATVVEAIASDRREVLTVSTLDAARGLFYSVPCTLGREGVLQRHTELLEHPAVQPELEDCLSALREQIGRAPTEGGQGRR